MVGMPTDDDVPYQPIPRQVVGNSFASKRVAAVCSGRWHNLAVVETGELYAWGAADAGRCGFAETDDMPRDEDNWPYQPVPRLVSGGALSNKKVVAVACGENHSLVVTADGQLLAWGSLHMGRCGFGDVHGLPTDDDNHPYQPVPRQVVGSPLDEKRVSSVACGTFHSLAVTEDGELYAWGSAFSGRCGFASLEGLPVDHDGVHYQPVPRQVSDGLQGRMVVSAACSEGHSYAITDKGELYAWGNADAGRCGLLDVGGMPADADGPYQPTPAPVGCFGDSEGQGKVRSVACGSWHSLAVTQDGRLFAWGAARAGRCGFADVSGLPSDDNGPFQPVPRQVVDGGLRGKRVALVACGSWHSLAATEEGSLYAWGVALMSRCGFETTGMPIDDLCPYQPTPLVVVAMPKVKLSGHLPTPPRGPDAVCADLRSLLAEQTYADVCFDVGGEQLRAHVAILVARCDHFRCMFRSGMAESRLSPDFVGSSDGGAAAASSSTSGTPCATGGNGAFFAADEAAPVRRVRITDCGPSVFRQLLVWLYSGSVDPGLPAEELAGILRLADLYHIPALRDECERLLALQVELENVLALLQVAIAAHASSLESVCLRFAVEHSSLVRRHATFEDCRDVEVMRRFAAACASELEAQGGPTHQRAAVGRLALGVAGQGAGYYGGGLPLLPPSLAGAGASLPALGSAERRPEVPGISQQPAIGGRSAWRI
eukprot:TRINITY_DN10785_c0_g2_i1.p1 TRINITY_DN10785_c0_g2~~TRINITY_DN10785_c0_g2_i1.p1  ORF type:complete len:794 (-),score=145.91 TRINITY_DN10785_c0_g2_i1:132-2270(-)